MMTFITKALLVFLPMGLDLIWLNSPSVIDPYLEYRDETNMRNSNLLSVILSISSAKITEFPKQLKTTNLYGQTNPRLLRTTRQ